MAMFREQKRKAPGRCAWPGAQKRFFCARTGRDAGASEPHHRLDGGALPIQRCGRFFGRNRDSQRSFQRALEKNFNKPLK